VILCPHAGAGTSVPRDPKWIVNDGPVLLDGDAGTLACLFIPPCIGYDLKSMKLNATQVDGRNVMLVTDFTQSFTGFPLTMTELHQTYDNSSPAPIPTGGPIPATPPQLQESDQPKVTVVPPTLLFSLSAFTSSGGEPVMLPMEFVLESQYPNRWLLTMLSVPTNSSTEITNGLPPAIVVAPPGGGWPDAVLSVTVSLQGVYLATLPVGTYYFVLTALNVRGKSSYAQATLTVTA
jgi:hypothetical protein